VLLNDATAYLKQQFIHMLMVSPYSLKSSHH